MASSTVRNEQTMRRKDGRGENEFSGAVAVMWALIESRELGWKSERSFRSVIRRVFDGGDGCCSGGTSIDSGVPRRAPERGELVPDILTVSVCLFFCLLLSWYPGGVLSPLYVFFLSCAAAFF